MRTLVYLIDGTLSRLAPGEETNVGRIYRLLQAVEGPAQAAGYHPGVQGEGARKWLHVAAGVGLNRAIRAGYVWLSERYRPGDRIHLFGYSRGGYAVRSLAGLIERIGLLRPDALSDRTVRVAYRLYERTHLPRTAGRFSAQHCRPAPITLLGAFDTVKALGLPYPLLNRMAKMATAFHDHAPGHNIAHALHALALDETRRAFKPVMWQQNGSPARIEQMWFPGSHADVGGQIVGGEAARPLSNIPLHWMLSRASELGLALPNGWDAMPLDPGAPSFGTWRRTGKIFWDRAPRRAGCADGEALHPSVLRRRAAVKGYRPKARLTAALRVPMPSATGGALADAVAGGA